MAQAPSSNASSAQRSLAFIVLAGCLIALSALATGQPTDFSTSRYRTAAAWAAMFLALR